SSTELTSWPPSAATWRSTRRRPSLPGPILPYRGSFDANGPVRVAPRPRLARSVRYPGGLHVKFGVVGCGQFASNFARLWHLHPSTKEVWVTDLIPERATALAEREGFAGTMGSFEEMLASDVDAIALM